MEVDGKELAYILLEFLNYANKQAKDITILTKKECILNFIKDFYPALYKENLGKE